MPRTSDKRDRLVEAAKNLIHRQGFHRTTLADIADESEVPLGNVYYYFKTKEDICEAVLEERRLKLQETFDGCCKSNQPKQHLIELVNKIINSSEKIAEHGCIIVSLCQALHKTEAPLRDTADKCIQEHIDWASKQFRKMGYKKTSELGFEFIARLEGIMLVGHALHEPKRIKSQLRATCKWIESL